MITLLKGLVVLGLSKLFFEWLNLTTMTIPSATGKLARLVYMSPWQIISAVGFTTGYAMAYKGLGSKIWLLLIVEETMNYAIKIGIRGRMFKQPIGPGTVVGLGLVLLAAIVAGVWK